MEKISLRKLRSVWRSLKPLMKDKYIIGKRYAVFFQSKRNKGLFIGKVLLRFLLDENGGVVSLEIRCLKPKVGHGTILEVTPYFKFCS